MNDRKTICQSLDRAAALCHCVDLEPATSK
jgi:hypothetical protein